MKHQTFNWKNKAQQTIFAQSWKIEQPKANLVMVHGMGEHSTRYTELAQFFTENNYNCYTFDQVGHGKSEGKRGHINNFSDLLEGIHHIIGVAQKDAPELPTILFGHSMGGNLVLNFTMSQQHNLTALVVSAPWLRLAFQPPAIKLTVAKLMNKIYPTYTEKSNIKGSRISRDKAQANAYDTDKLIHGEITTRFFYSIIDSAKWILKNAEKLKTPTLLCHGTGDSMTAYNASQEFANKAGNQLIFKTYDGWYHELHNEIDRKEYYQDLLAWIDTHI